uniref:Uncharacterized protein LOC114342658 isoform X2 n=1 Tax=Diabrotica virgifera virgifera TaxID=50390 RepID=A0A6P7GZS3_DIAVI
MSRSVLGTMDHYNDNTVNLTYSYSRNSRNFTRSIVFRRKENTEWSPLILIPLLATVVLIVTVFLLMMFRQNPTFVISTVACCLIFVTVYLIMVAMDSSRQYLY